MSSYSMQRPGRVFKAFECAFKDLQDECKHARHHPNAGNLLICSPPGKKTKLTKLYDKLVKELEHAEPKADTQIKPYEQAVKFKEPRRRKMNRLSLDVSSIKGIQSVN